MALAVAGIQAGSRSGNSCLALSLSPVVLCLWRERDSERREQMVVCKKGEEAREGLYSGTLLPAGELSIGVSIGRGGL